MCTYIFKFILIAVVVAALRDFYLLIMLRLYSKLNSYRVYPNQLILKGVNCNGSCKRILQTAPATCFESEFVKEANPLPVSLLRELSLKDTPIKLTTREYLIGDPQPVDVFSRDNINKNRIRVMDQLSFDSRRRRGNNHILIVSSAKGIPGYPFQQRSEFLYLCDCLLSNVVLIIIRNRKMQLYTMLCEPERVGDLDPELDKIACQRYNVDEIVTLPRLTQILRKMGNNSTLKLWYKLDKSKVSDYVRELADQLKLSISCPIRDQRLAMSVKSKNEVIAIKRAHSIAAQSMQEVICQHVNKIDKPKICCTFMNNCRERYAYQPVPFEPKVIAGLGNMCLMDATCQYAGYYGRLARSWPIYGRFTPPLKVIYTMILDLRYKINKMLTHRDSAMRTPRKLQDAYLFLLAKHLKALRIVRKNSSMDAARIREFVCYPPQISHIGLDISSEELLDTPLVPNNIVSLQLSVAIPQNCHETYPEFCGIMCILTDSILIKENNNIEFLTGNCMSSCRDLEKLLARQPKTANWYT